MLRSAAHTITSVVTECNQATRTMSQLRLAPDRFLADSGQAPDDYGGQTWTDMLPGELGDGYLVAEFDRVRLRD